MTDGLVPKSMSSQSIIEGSFILDYLIRHWVIGSFRGSWHRY